MRWSPCGKAVDIGSRPFRATYRPFRNSDEEVEIEWFPCAPGAENYDGVSCITIPQWEREQFEFTDGLLPLSTVVPTGKPVTRPGTGRGHVCGSEEDHREGGLYEPLEPPVVYGQLGLPHCCGAPVVAGAVCIDSATCEVVYPVVPGATCETATALPFGVWSTWTIVAGQDYWFTVPAYPPLTIDVCAEELSGTATVGNPWNLYAGTCGSPVFLGTNPAPGCWNYGGTTILQRIVGLAGGTGQGVIRIFAGVGPPP